MSQAIIKPGTIKIVAHFPTYNRDNWELSKEALEYSNEALLAYCGSSFGGTVTRGADGVTVSVYTD